MDLKERIYSLGCKSQEFEFQCRSYQCITSCWQHDPQFVQTIASHLYHLHLLDRSHPLSPVLILPQNPSRRGLLAVILFVPQELQFKPYDMRHQILQENSKHPTPIHTQVYLLMVLGVFFGFVRNQIFFESRLYFFSSWQDYLRLNLQHFFEDFQNL